MSVVSRAGVSRHPPTLAEGWTPFELGDDRRAPPLPAEGRLIGISRDLPVSRACGGPEGFVIGGDGVRLRAPDATAFC